MFQDGKLLAGQISRQERDVTRFHGWMLCLQLYVQILIQPDLPHITPVPCHERQRHAHHADSDPLLNILTSPPSSPCHPDSPHPPFESASSHSSSTPHSSHPTLPPSAPPSPASSESPCQTTSGCSARSMDRGRARALTFRMRCIC